MEARPGPSALFGFLFRRRRRRPEDEEPALEDMSDSSSWRLRSSIMASFDWEGRALSSWKSRLWYIGKEQYGRAAKQSS